MKNALIILFLFLFLASCDRRGKNEIVSPVDKNDSLYIIDIDNITKDKYVNFSSYFKSAKTIILETNENCLINNVSNIRVVDDFIIIVDNDQHPGGIFVFDKTGHFIHKIGKVGQGPGEYVYVTDVSIDFNKKELYLFDSYNNRINRYDIKTARFISSMNIHDNGLGISYINFIDNEIFANAIPYSKTEDSFLLQKIDKSTGKCVNSYLKSSEYNRGWNELFLRTGGFFYPVANTNSKYVEMFMDTIISIEKESIKPFLAFKAKNWITSKDIDELIKCQEEGNESSFHRILFEKDISYNINHYFETESMIGFQYYNNMSMPYVMYDKVTNTVRTTDLFQDDIVFDVDGVILTTFAFSDSKGVYGYVKTDQIQFLLDFLHTGKVHSDLDKINELKKLTEDSNPVIFYYESLH